MIGVLGTNTVRTIQNSLHSLGNRSDAEGWDNQISDGGELTASYPAARHETLALHQAPGGGDYQVQMGTRGSVGFVTQVGLGIVGRWGRFSTPWWAFIPDYAEYISLGLPIPGRAVWRPETCTSGAVWIFVTTCTTPCSKGNSATVPSPLTATS